MIDIESQDCDLVLATAILRNLAYNITQDEPGTISTVLRLVVYDGIFFSLSEDLTIQIQPINDNLPEITIPSREVPFVEENPVSDISSCSSWSYDHRSRDSTTHSDNIPHCGDLKSTKLHQRKSSHYGSLSPDVTFNSSNPHRLVIQAVNAPLQFAGRTWNCLLRKHCRGANWSKSHYSHFCN